MSSSPYRKTKGWRERASANIAADYGEDPETQAWARTHLSRAKVYRAPGLQHERAKHLPVAPGGGGVLIGLGIFGAAVLLGTIVGRWWRKRGKSA